MNLGNINYLINAFIRNSYYGFSFRENYQNKDDLLMMINEVQNKDDIIESFESSFSSIVGDGNSISFAAARMAFYSFMDIININAGDEIIIQAGTCSVMINAILRKRAIPIYADINPNNFGTSSAEIEKLITDNTKLIVAQHSFGIPCNINEIAKIAKEHGIYLLEDCALTLGSEIDNTVCGNFGDAAIFSTDNTKPLNTLMGGLFYTNNNILFDKMKEQHKKLLDLSEDRQMLLCRDLSRERFWQRPLLYGKSKLIFTFLNKLYNKESSLNEDYGTNITSNYPYPCKMPKLLALLGIYELSRWSKNVHKRTKIYNSIFSLFKDLNLEFLLPGAYFNKDIKVIPLRFVWSQNNGHLIRQQFSKFVDVGWTWFKEPIVCRTEPIENYGYEFNSCKISERIGAGIVNLPCVIPDQHVDSYLSKIHHTLKYLKNNNLLYAK